MKLLKKTFLLTISILLFLACNEEENQSIINNTLKRSNTKSRNKIKFENSKKKWDSLKLVKGNSYTYQMKNYFLEQNISDETTFVIQDGEITSRVYKEYKLNPINESKVLISTYTESKDENNINTYYKGLNARTIDELYDNCFATYINNEVHLAQTTGATVVFSTSNDSDNNKKGIMSNCGYINFLNSDIIDVAITSFEWL